MMSTRWRRVSRVFRPGLRLVTVTLLLTGLVPVGAAVALAQDLGQLDAFIAQAQRDWPVPGLAVVVVKDGETVLAKGYGVRELGGSDPVDENTIFAIASNTKAFTAAAMAILVEEGKLDWNDPVRDHLPDFQLYNPYVSQEMRIRDLLSHRSGLGTFSGDLLWYGTGYSAAEVVRRARFLPAAGPFRASYGYSNLMFIAAGEVIAAVSGMPWKDFMEARILRPLGMAGTVTTVRDLQSIDNVATPHKNRTDGIFPVAWYNWDAMAAAGGIISSASDMARWMKLRLNHGELEGLRLFSEESSWEMWTIHTPMGISPEAHRSEPSTHFRGYGLGWSLNDYQGLLVASHGGGYDGMFSRVVLVPEEKLGIAVLTNSMTSVGTAIANTLLDAYLGAPERDWSGPMLRSWQSARDRFEERQDRFLAERAPDSRPSLPLDAYTGRYGGDMYGDGTVSLENGGLVLRLLPNPDLVADLTHLHDDTFLIEWRHTFAWFGRGAATFLLDSDGEVREVKLDVPNDDLWFYELELRRKER
jgi:CubicO group peptidase (beta-lactamase class C family)